MLNAELHGSGPRLVLVHGFTQTGRSWGSFGEVVGRGRELVCVDLPGHAGSTEVRADLAGSAELVAEVAGSPAAGGIGFDLLGYSLGGRVALHVALLQPAGLRRLILVSATAGIEDAHERDLRRQADERLGEEAERDVESFLRGWIGRPMFSGLTDPGLADRLRNTGAGLASSLRLAGTGTQWPLWTRLGEVRVPVLFVCGATDVRFARIAARMAASVNDGVCSLVPGAGHAAHLEQPRICAALVTHFLA